MDDQTAAALLQQEKTRVLELLRDISDAAAADRASLDEQGDWEDPAVSLIAEEGENAVAESLRERLAAIERAEQRLREGTYGRSVRSGAVIPDERLEANPAADLTAEEASEG